LYDTFIFASLGVSTSLIIRFLMALSALDRIFQSSAPPPSSSKPQTSFDSREGEIKELPGGYKRLPNGIILDKDGKP
jgi:hypothetical protein